MSGGKMIELLKTKIIVWAMNNMVYKFVANDDKNEMEIHLKTGYIIYTKLDDVKSIVEDIININRLKDSKK